MERSLMIKPYLFYGSKIFHILDCKDGQTVATEKRILGTEIVWCEEMDLANAKVNLEIPAGPSSVKMEVLKVWELFGREIKVPTSCKGCQFRNDTCLETCPCIRRS
jgi:hypothetical protein